MTTRFSLNEAGTLTVGVDASSPGAFHMGEPGSPDFRGFEVDLVNLVGEKLGLSVKHVGNLWSETLELLRCGKLDMVCTAATISEERLMQFDFSDPYFDFKLCLLVATGSSVRGMGDLRGQTVGVRIATTAEQYVRERLNASLVKTFHMNVDVYQALQRGDVAAVVEDHPIARFFEGSFPRLHIVSEIDGTDSHYGMVLAKGSDILRNRINTALNEIKSEGIHGELLRKWFHNNDSFA